MPRRFERATVCIAGFALSLVVIAVANTQHDHFNADDSQKAQEIETRGRVVDLAEEMHKRFGADASPNHKPLYGFKTEGDLYYTLLRTNLAEALFVDRRLLKKELIITGRTFPKTQILEAIRLQSVHNGVVHDLYYYCETCAIRTVAPGDCECCGEPVELTETPLRLMPMPNR